MSLSKSELELQLAELENYFATKYTEHICKLKSLTASASQTEEIIKQSKVHTISKPQVDLIDDPDINHLYITGFFYTLCDEDKEKHLTMLELRDILEVKKLVLDGKARSEIFAMNIYSSEILFKAGLGASDLIPLENSIDISMSHEYSIPNNCKWEYYNGQFFGNNYKRDTLILMLLADAGLKHILDILPSNSIDTLKGLLKNY